jgi:hypothetical protein
MMANAFSTSTTVTLLFTGWTTRTPAQYFGALAFLFFLTLLNRFLGAWRFQLGRVWADQAARARLERNVQKNERQRDKLHNDKLPSLRKVIGLRIGDSRKPDDEELTPLSPDIDRRSLSRIDTKTGVQIEVVPSSPMSQRYQHQGMSENYPLEFQGHAHTPGLGHSRNASTDTVVTKTARMNMADTELANLAVPVAQTIPGPRWTKYFGGGRWRASNPWRVKIDVPRALLEFVRTGIGYVL